MSIIRHLLIKEFKQIFRTREMLAIMFGVPIVQLIVLGFSITNEVKNVSLLISDSDNSRVSREIVRTFDQTDRFTIIDFITDQREIESALQNWQAQVALVIPAGFGKDYERGRSAEIQLLADGLDGNTAGIALGYAQRLLIPFMTPSTISMQRLSTKKNPAVHLVQMEERMWFNENLDNAQYMIPGIICVLLTIISMMLSSINLVREKEIGTLEQLMVTPIKKYQLLLGKILPFLILTFIELGIVTFFGRLIFSVQIHGSYLLLAALSFLFLFTTLGLGIFISTITHTQQQAMFVSWFIMVFMIMISGFFIPIDNMPDFIQKLTFLNPMRYYLYIVRDIIQKDAAWFYLLKDAIPMTFYGLLIFVISTLKFQKRIS
jgi:ABC-2 type transport system permease protein